MNDARVTDVITRTLGRPPRAWRAFAGGQQDVFAVSVDADDDLVLKLARPGNHARLRHETLVLSILPDGVGPRVVAAGDGFVLMRSSGPENLARRFKRGDDCAAAFREMGRRLRVLHETPLDAAPAEAIAALQAARADVARVVLRDARGRYARAGDSREHHARWPAFARLVEATVAASASPARLLHGDYNTRQVVLDANGRVSAVVDFEYACLGDPALDLLRMELSGIRGREDFYAGYGGEELDAKHGPLMRVLDALDAAVAADDAARCRALAALHDAIDAIEPS